MAMIVLDLGQAFASFGKVLVVVQVTRIARDAVIVAHIDRFRHLLACHKGFKQFLSMTRTDHLHLRIQILRIDLRVCLFQRLCQDRQSGCRRFLHEQVTVMPMCKGIDHQVDRIIQRHHEARHLRVGNRDRFTLFHLFHPERDHGTPARHHIAVARAADRRLRPFAQLTSFGDRHLFHQRLGDPHRIDRISGFIRRKDHHILHAMLDRGKQHILRPFHIRTGRFHRKELATGNLFQGRSREHIVHTPHRHIHRCLITHIPYIKFYFGILQLMTHIILFFLITAKDTDLLNIGIQKTPKHSVTERTSASGDQEGFVFENTHIIVIC